MLLKVSFSHIIDKYLIDFFQNNYADSDFEHLFDKIECLQIKKTSGKTFKQKTKKKRCRSWIFSKIE